MSAVDPKPQPAPFMSVGRDIHRKVVIADLNMLAEQIHERIELEGCTTKCGHWPVMRCAADIAESFAEILPAADALSIEARDLTALAEHALSVLAQTVAAVDTAREEAWA